MQVSESGKQFIKEHEGLRLIRYTDAGGKDTVGYGHLVLASDLIGTSISQDQADSLLNADLRKAEKAVNDGILVAISQEQFDALVSFVFNVGASAFATGTLRRLINQRADDQEIYNWWTTHYITAGGQTVAGLVQRRKDEADLFRYGDLKKKSPSPSASCSSSPLQSSPSSF